MAERVPAALAPFSPPPGMRIAGTNGKGSTCAMLEAMLMAGGLRVGTFTSPHLVHVEERIRINGVPIPPEQMDALAEDAPGLNFFEALILVALRAFTDVDVIIWEAGIGGWSDPVRFLPASVSAITTVGFDHMDRLGDTLAAIGRDKAGITDGPLVIGPAVDPALIPRAAFQAPRVPVVDHGLDGFDYDGVRVPLAGAHQHDNLATALAVVRGFPHDVRGLANVRWPGRLQRVHAYGRDWILDVAHNPEGLLALERALAPIPYAERCLVYGAATGKDVAACLPIVRRLAPRIIAVGGFYRSGDPAALGADHVCDDVAEAIPLVSGRPIVAGSVFLVGAMKAALGG